MAVQVGASAGASDPSDVRVVEGLPEFPSFPYIIRVADPESMDSLQVSLSKAAAQSLLVKLANTLGREVSDESGFPF